MSHKCVFEVPTFNQLYTIQLHQFLKKVQYHKNATNEMFFDANQDSVAGFDILNWVVFKNRTFLNRKVGRIVPHHTSREPSFLINSTAIVWHAYFHMVRTASLNQYYNL